MNAIDRRPATSLLRTWAMLIAAVAVAMTAAVLVAGSAPAAPPDGKGPPDGMGHDDTVEEYVAPASLYSIEVDKTGLTRLTQGTADEYNVWSDNNANVAHRGPNAGAIVFASTQPDPVDGSEDADLWLLHPDGTLEQLTQNSVVISDETGEEEPIQDLNPVFSYDGTKVAYQSVPLPAEEEEGEEGAGGSGSPAASGQAQAQIFVLDLATGVSEQVTMIKATIGAAKYPTWSPDGTKIAFTVGDGTPQHLAVVDVGTKVVTDLTPEGSTDSMPAWSPDGTKVAFTTGLGIAMDIHVIDVDTKVETVLAATAEMESEPAWSPDGTQIAYQRGDESLGAAIFVMDADGSDQTRITTATSWSDRDPAFTPDGAIVFESTVDSVPAANLGVGKTSTPTAAVPGQEVTYVVSVTNAGPLTATGITVVDTVPAGMQILSATAALTPSEHGEEEVEEPTFTPTATIAGQVVTADFGDLPKGERGAALGTLTIVVKATAIGTYVNTAVITLDAGDTDLIDPIASNDTASATTTVTAVPVPPTPPAGGGGTPATTTTPGGPLTAPGGPPTAPGPFLPPVSVGKTACTIIGTAGNDVLTGTPGRDVICGLGGDDVLSGLAGNDLIVGGPGNDRLIGGAGNDILNGQDGNDFVDGTTGNDVLYGGTGNDVLTHTSGKAKLYAGSGNDTLFARDNGYDWVNGGLGRDVATIDRKVDRTYGIETIR